MAANYSLSDSERNVLTEFRAAHPQAKPWQFSTKYLLLLALPVALAAWLSREAGVGVVLLILVGFVVCSVNRRRWKVRRQVTEEIKGHALPAELERYETALGATQDSKLKHLLGSMSGDQRGEQLNAAWFGTVLAGAAYVPVMVLIATLVADRPWSTVAAGGCGAIGGFLSTAFLALPVLAVVAGSLYVLGFQASQFAIGSLVGGLTGLTSVGWIYEKALADGYEYYVATGIAVLMGQLGAAWAVWYAGEQTTQRIFKPPTQTLKARFSMGQLFLLCTLIAAASAGAARLDFQNRQLIATYATAAWLLVTIGVDFCVNRARRPRTAVLDTRLPCETSASESTSPFDEA